MRHLSVSSRRAPRLKRGFASLAVASRLLRDEPPDESPEEPPAEERPSVAAAEGALRPECAHARALGVRHWSWLSPQQRGQPRCRRGQPFCRAVVQSAGRSAASRSWPRRQPWRDYGGGGRGGTWGGTTAGRRGGRCGEGAAAPSASASGAGACGDPAPPVPGRAGVGFACGVRHLQGAGGRG